VSVALDIQQALRVRHIAICLTVQYFFTLFHKGKIFEKTYSECVSVALDIQQALRLRHIAICLTVQYFFCVIS